MSNTIVLITGANTGLGLEIVRALLRSSRPYTILLGSRNPQKGEQAASSIADEATGSPHSKVHVLAVDVESDGSIKKAADHIQSTYGRLDVLVNNAGGNFGTDIQQQRLGLRDAWLKSWNVNVAGPVVLTEALAPLLLKSKDPRVLFVTSGTSTLVESELFDRPDLQRINASPAAGWPKATQLNDITSYRSTKAGLNMAMREYTRILKEDGVKVWGISPGFLATGLNGIGEEQLKKMGAQDPKLGGDFVADVIEGGRDEHVGKVIQANKIQPW